MLKSILLNILLQAATRLLSKDIIGQIKALVNEAMDMSMAGPEKKASVMERLLNLGGAIGQAIAETASYFLSMGVDIVVAQTKYTIEREAQKQKRLDG